MNINIQAPINQLSYGIVGINVLKHMMLRGIGTSLFPIGPIQCEQQYAEFVQNSINNSMMFDKNATSLRIFHQFSMAESIGKGQRIGYTIFELDSLTDVEKNHLSSLDCVVVPTEWAKQVITNNINTECKVVPLGVDIYTFKPIEMKGGYGHTSFINIGKWSINKGHDVLCDIFNAAFEPSDDVLLYMCNHNFFLKPEEQQEWQNHYKNSKMGSKIRFVDRVPSQTHLAEMMNQMDCGIFPSRAEGWNMCALEMMACGKPVILTDYSGHTGFATEENSMLIKIDELEPAYDGKWFLGEGPANVGSWAKIGKNQIDQFVEYMRRVHRVKQECGLRVNLEGIKTAKKFRWDNTVDKLLYNI